jgi:3-hydroxybutyryl-CoA dehydratase
VSES